MQKQVDSAMTKEPISIAPDVLLSDAYEIMRSWGMRHLPVTDNQAKVIGLLSERDVLRYMAFHPGTKPVVRQAMSEDPYVVAPDETLSDIAATMAHQKFGCAVVADEKGVRGIFTTTDALKILARMLREPDGDPFKLMRIEDYFRTRAVA